MMLFPNFWFQVNPDNNIPNTAAYRILPGKYFFFFFKFFFNMYIIIEDADSEFSVLGQSG